MLQQVFFAGRFDVYLFIQLVASKRITLVYSVFDPHWAVNALILFRYLINSFSVLGTFVKKAI